ncbi:MAG: GGDEF domain-containing protein [Pseudobutyrivibrio sp.]|nr:GGDEF domain-containing protein [Pseudobutyrivibrio sp.]
MKLFQTIVDKNFKDIINQWASEIPKRDNCALFHIYVPYTLPDGFIQAQDVIKALEEVFDNPHYMGCSSTGEIFKGRISKDAIVVSAIICEDDDTSICILPYYSLRESLEAEEIVSYMRSIPNLRGIEILSSAEYQRMEDVGSLIDILPDDIDIFGAVAVGDNDNKAYVFADRDNPSFDGTVFAIYSGKNLNVSATRIFGWKSIGYPFKVTRADGPVVYELDGKPIYDVYRHYLQLDKDDNFFYDALEFPLEVEVDDKIGGYIRHAKSVRADGSILMSTTIPEGSNVRFTYGDPRRMLDHTKRAGVQINEFGPDILLLFNCFGRMLFWEESCNDEIRELSKYAQATGFSALGEIMRYNSTTLLNNLSIVVVSIREGKLKKHREINEDEYKPANNLPITARLAIFINTITDELMVKNNQLNDMLYKASHDYLTGLLNRGAIENMIYDALDNQDIAEKDWYLLMLDIDDFKQINDKYGHSEGDQVLKDMAKYLVDNVKDRDDIDGGRWGGEEFMLFSYGFSDEKMKEIAEMIRMKAKSTDVMHRPITLSIGLTKHRKGESAKDVIDRVDALLYKAKKNGKNQVCTDL